MAILAAPLLFIFVATLLPGATAEVGPTACALCSYSPADTIVNILLYAPFGLAAAHLGWRTSRILLIAAALSTLIEFSQIFLTGRDASVLDIATNLAGAGLGILLLRTAPVWVCPRPRVASRLAALAAFAAIGLLAASDYLLRPSYPAARYYGQWTARFPNLESYRGEVLEVHLGDLALPSHDLERSDSVRSLLRRGAPLELRFLAGPVVRDLAPVFSIADDQGRSIFLVGVDRYDVVIGHRTLLAPTRLRELHFRAPGAMAGFEPGDTVRLRVEKKPSGFCILMDAKSFCGLQFPLGSGWAFLLSRDRFSGWAIHILNALWMIGLFLPFGFWARPDWLSGGAALVLCGGLLALPALGELEATVEYVAGPTGALAGLILSRWWCRPARVAGARFERHPGKQPEP